MTSFEIGARFQRHQIKFEHWDRLAKQAFDSAATQENMVASLLKGV